MDKEKLLEKIDKGIEGCIQRADDAFIDTHRKEYELGIANGLRWVRTLIIQGEDKNMDDKVFKYLTNNEIATHSYSDALSLAEILLNNGYVVMISKEEKLYIVNYIWSSGDADRDDVCFQSRDEIEDNLLYNC